MNISKKPKSENKVSDRVELLEEIRSLSFIQGNTVLADGLNVEELYARAPRRDGPYFLACPNHMGWDEVKGV